VVAAAPRHPPPAAGGGAPPPAGAPAAGGRARGGAPPGPAAPPEPIDLDAVLLAFVGRDVKVHRLPRQDADLGCVPLDVRRRHRRREPRPPRRPPVCILGLHGVRAGCVAERCVAVRDAANQAHKQGCTREESHGELPLQLGTSSPNGRSAGLSPPSTVTPSWQKEETVTWQQWHDVATYLCGSDAANPTAGRAEPTVESR